MIQGRGRTLRDKYNNLIVIPSLNKKYTVDFKKQWLSLNLKSPLSPWPSWQTASIFRGHRPVKMFCLNDRQRRQFQTLEIPHWMIPPIPQFPPTDGLGPSVCGSLSSHDTWRQLKLHQSQFSTPLVPTQVPPVPVFKTGTGGAWVGARDTENWDWGNLSWGQGSWKLGLGERELAPGILKTGTGGAWVGARDLENWDWGSLSWRQGSWKLGLGELELAPGILKTGTGGAWVGARDLENWDWGSLSWRQGSWKLGLGELELGPGILKTGTGGAWVGARDLENWDWGSLSWGQGSWKLGLGELELAPGILKTGTGGAWVGARDLENWDWGSLSWRKGSSRSLAPTQALPVPVFKIPWVEFLKIYEKLWSIQRKIW